MFRTCVRMSGDKVGTKVHKNGKTESPPVAIHNVHYEV